MTTQSFSLRKEEKNKGQLQVSSRPLQNNNHGKMTKIIFSEMFLGEREPRPLTFRIFCLEISEICLCIIGWGIALIVTNKLN